MKKGIIWFLFLSLVVVACNYNKRVNESDIPAPMPEIADVTTVAARWADSVCATLTVRQKVAQLFMPAIYASDDYWTVRQIREYADSCIGGVVLLKGDTKGAAALADTFQSICKIPPFIAIDAEWGLAMRLTDAPEFPSNSEIANDADDQLLFEYGRELARECRQLGINVVLGPVVDVSAPNGFMRRRSFGSDPHRVADLAIAYAKGLEAGGVVSVAKHFPGHGSVSTDSHKSKGVIDRSLNEMDSIDIYPFRKWVEQRLSGVMVGHLAVPAIDSRMLPAAMSKVVITDLLRTDLEFTGLVLTDAINMKGADGLGAETAVAAGADIVVAPDNTALQMERVVRAVEQDLISFDELNRHVRRILFYKYLLTQAIKADSNDNKGDANLSPILNSEQADSISRLLIK